MAKSYMVKNLSSFKYSAGDIDDFCKVKNCIGEGRSIVIIDSINYTLQTEQKFRFKFYWYIDKSFNGTFFRNSSNNSLLIA